MSTRPTTVRLTDQRSAAPFNPDSAEPEHSAKGPNAPHCKSGAPLAERYEQIRAFSRTLCEPLTTEDYVIQSMPDVSPTKWHLAHTSWFFETFVLKHALRSYRPLDPQFEYLFNSYYNTVGEQYCRPMRGMLSRPTVKDIQHYRDHVDHHMR
ncbi:MAG: hypothetical protein EA377_00510, partial [Phycisphaerales bacterium]